MSYLRPFFGLGFLKSGIWFSIPETPFINITILGKGRCFISLDSFNEWERPATLGIIKADLLQLNAAMTQRPQDVWPGLSAAWDSETASMISRGTEKCN